MTNRSRYHGHTTQPQSTISSKIVAVFALMLVIAFAVALAKYLQTSENQTTNVTFASSERISDNSLRVWVDVKRKNVDTPAYCIVTALNYDMAEVGRREVYISPGGETCNGCSWILLRGNQRWRGARMVAERRSRFI